MSLKIGEIARLSGVPAKTIRYYESVGIIDKPERTRNDYRSYREETARTLRFIRQARRLGFSLEEVRALLALWKDRSRPSREVKALAARRIAEIDDRIAELERLRGELSHLMSACHGDNRPECPILDALDPTPAENRTMNATTYRVTGMTCGGCARSMRSALERAAPGLKTEVSFADDTVVIHGEHDPAVVEKAVIDSGFEFGGVLG